MVFTRKFSEFPDGGTLASPDMPVGLEGDVNTRWEFAGGGGGGSGGTSFTFPQPSPPVTNGSWVRITPGSGIYTAGQADNAQDAEIIGLVVAANVATFTLQQSGYVSTAMAVPTIIGLTAGTVYFLDTASLGIMVPTDAIANGTVSRPCFVADSATSGWIVPYRPILVSGQASPSGTPSSGTDTSIVTINQTAHGFVPGDVLRVDTGATGGPILYAKALADTLAHAQVAGIVCATPAPSANQFTLQFSGYNVGSITADDIGSPVVASIAYYLSSTVAGKVTSVNPVLAISKPVYIPEQGSANLGVNAGYIFPQRPLDNSNTNNNIHTVFAANAFNPGQWVYIQSNGVYQLAIATSLASSQVAGVITAATGSQFTVQQNGWIAGVVSTTYIDQGSITSGAVYYLSSANAGNLSISPPILVGQVTKPCYVQENSATLTGQILPQRPLVISNPSAGGGYYQLIQTMTISPGTTVIDFPNIFDGTYKDIKIVGENFRMNVMQTPSSFLVGAVAFSLYTNGTLTPFNYYYAVVLSGNINFLVNTNRSFAFNTTNSTAAFTPPSSAVFVTRTATFIAEAFSVNTISTKTWNLYNTTSIAISGSQELQISTGTATGMYFGDINPITGFQLYLPGSTPGATYQFYQGNLSIYGIKG